MSALDSHELTHPELLSERQLCQILQNSCIETSHFKKLCKAELVELYKKVALPLPQRRRDDSKNKEESNDTNHNSHAEVDDWKSNKDNIHSTSTSTLSEQIKISTDKQLERLKPPIQDTQAVSKKICLSSVPKIESDYNGIIKRKITEINQDSSSSVKKRQKITWP